MFDSLWASKLQLWKSIENNVQIQINKFSTNQLDKKKDERKK